MNTLKELIAKVKEIFLEECFVSEPKELYEPIDYTLRLGGKRLRPVMLMAAYEMFGGKADELRYPAMGIEVFHNFTLLHDDLMDKSPIRRGQPTVYRKWDENVAVLSGDTMFAMAWGYFLKKETPYLMNVLNTFNRTAIEVCEGQQYDMNFETMENVSIEEYVNMIRLKTSVLLAGALKIGAQYANAPEEDIKNLYAFGENLGLAFQLQDDLLDSYGNVAEFGKQIGTDIQDNKKTYLYLKALELSGEGDEKLLRDLFSTKPDDASGKVAKVLSIYEKYSIKEETEKMISVFFNKAKDNLEAIKLDFEQKSVMYELIEQLLGRKY